MKLREARGWSQEDLAGKAGLSVKTVSRFENGRHEGRNETVRKLAKALKVNEVDVTGPPPPPLGLETQGPPIEGELAAILERIEAQLDDQNRVLKDIQREQATLKKLIAAEKTARTEAETARTRLLEAAEVASRAYEDAARRLAKAPGTQAT